MRLFRGPCHYGHELLPDFPFGWRELFTRGIIVIQRKLRPKLKLDIPDPDINKQIKELISRKEPCLVSRFGTIELEATFRGRDIMRPCSRFKKFLMLFTDRSGPFWWDNSICAGLCNNAGFFPPTSEMMMRFSKLVLEDVKQVDLLGAFEMPISYRSEQFPQAKMLSIHQLEPFWYPDPWTAALAGRKVLVIHSMPESIKRQYQHRRQLFDDSSTLPDFTLITYKSVNSAMGIKTEFSNWFEALDKMKSDISKIDFDIALLGCGAYGMSLGAFIKRDLRKQAIHLGGRVQLLFGIKGRRWDNDPAVAKYYKDNWIRPLDEDTPHNISRVEGGCYW